MYLASSCQLGCVAGDKHFFLLLVFYLEFYPNIQLRICVLEALRVLVLAVLHKS